MKENPYSKIVETMKKQTIESNPLSIQIGEVIEVPPNLMIKVNDLLVDKDNILIADYLLKEEYIRECRASNDKETWSDTNYIKYIDTLEKGDRLAVMPTKDRQLYIIVARLKEVS